LSIVTSPPDNAQILIDDFPHNESQSQSKKQLVTGTIEGLSHQEMQTLTDYSLSSIRSKASLGNSITAKDGFTYRYNKNPKVLKWVKV
jgi:putative ATP-binding cassette transporter